MGILRKFFRRKVIDRDLSTELKRTLSTIDLTLLGIGSTLGLGIYVLAGSVAKTNAGPAVVLSFFVAAFASVLAGLCYAEFGARVPKAGSAYVYSYVCVGELIAFIVGWNLIMEYIIGVASVAKGYSGYVDSLFPDHAMRKAFQSVGTIDVEWLGTYFDFFAFGIVILLTLLLMFGVKESSIVNNIFTVLNLAVVIFTIVAGAIYSNTSNWNIDPTQPPQCKNMSHHEAVPAGEVGDGHFAPFGFAGIMAGAATCFYGFIGFDVIATTGEEAKNPKRAIPISIVLSLLFIFLAYSSISTVITMILPYYCQDKDAPLPYAFEYQGFTIGKWVVNIGSLFGLSTSLLGSIFPMPRIVYSMAKDGLLFNFFAYVHPKFQTPIWATLIGGLLGAIMGGLFNLDSLIDMMSIGTLTAYTLVAMCVLMLRYRKDASGADDTGFDDSEERITMKSWFSQIFNLNRLKLPTRLSSIYTLTVVVLYWIFCFGFCGTAIIGQDELHEAKVIVPMIIFGVLMIFSLISLCFQPTSRLELTFKVPLLPFLPASSMLINTYLILKLSGPTWIRFSVWMGLGMLVYAICLLTGRADKKYKEASEEHAKKLRNVAKVSIHGIDNPALNLDDEKQPEDKEQENPTKQGDNDNAAADDHVNKTVDDDQREEPPLNNIEPPSYDVSVKGMLKSALKSSVNDEKLQMSSPPPPPIEEPYDLTTSVIHEINQNVLKVNFNSNDHRPFILDLEQPQETFQNKKPSIVSFITQDSKSDDDEEPFEPAPAEIKQIEEDLLIHENVQKCLLTPVIDDNNETKTETEKALEIVDAIITEAEQNHDNYCSKDAELLVEDILMIAQEKASLNSQDTLPPADPEPLPLPLPQITATSPLSAELTDKLHLLDQQSKEITSQKPIQPPTIEEKPLKIVPTKQQDDLVDDDEGHYAQVDSLMDKSLPPPPPPPPIIVVVDEVNENDQQNEEPLPPPPIPPIMHPEPLYATVNKTKLSTDIPIISVSLIDPPEAPEDDSGPKRSLTDRRPTGPCLPQREKLKLNQSDNSDNLLPELEEDEEEADHDQSSVSVKSSSSLSRPEAPESSSSSSGEQRQQQHR